VLKATNSFNNENPESIYSEMEVVVINLFINFREMNCIIPPKDVSRKTQRVLS